MKKLIKERVVKIIKTLFIIMGIWLLSTQNARAENIEYIQRGEQRIVLEHNVHNTIPDNFSSLSKDKKVIVLKSIINSISFKIKSLIKIKGAQNDGFFNFKDEIYCFDYLGNDTDPDCLLIDNSEADKKIKYMGIEHNDLRVGDFRFYSEIDIIDNKKNTHEKFTDTMYWYEDIWKNSFIKEKPNIYKNSKIFITTNDNLIITIKVKAEKVIEPITKNIIIEVPEPKVTESEVTESIENKYLNALPDKFWNLRPAQQGVKLQELLSKDNNKTTERFFKGFEYYLARSTHPYSFFGSWIADDYNINYFSQNDYLFSDRIVNVKMKLYLEFYYNKKSFFNNIEEHIKDRINVHVRNKKKSLMLKNKLERSYQEILLMPDYETMEKIKLYKTMIGFNNDIPGYKFINNEYEFGWSNFQKSLYRQEMKMPGFIDEVEKIVKSNLEELKNKWNFSDDYVYIDRIRTNNGYYNPENSDMIYYIYINSQEKGSKRYSDDSNFYIKINWRTRNLEKNKLEIIDSGEQVTKKIKLINWQTQLLIPAGRCIDKSKTADGGWILKQKCQINIDLYVENKETGEYDLMDSVEKVYWRGVA